MVCVCLYPGLLSQFSKLFRATTACWFLERHADLLSERVPRASVRHTKVSLGRATKHKAPRHAAGRFPGVMRAHPITKITD